jgi:hypothetical protein
MYAGDDRAAAATAAAAAVGDGVLRATNAVLESQRATIADMMTKNSSLSSRLGIAEHDLQRVRAERNGWKIECKAWRAKYE